MTSLSTSLSTSIFFFFSHDYTAKNFSHDFLMSALLCKICIVCRVPFLFLMSLYQVIVTIVDYVTIDQ